MRRGGLEEFFVEAVHSGDWFAGVGVQNPRVPCGEECSGKPGDHDGVVDVGDESDSGGVFHDEDAGFGGGGTFGLDLDGVPAGVKVVVFHQEVNVAVVVGG